METESVPSLTGRIALLIAEVARILGLFAVMPLAPRWVANLVHGRVRRLGERFARLAARIEAGKVRARREEDAAPGPGHPSPRPSPSGGEGEKLRVRKPWVLPRTIGWIARNVAGAWPCMVVLEKLLADAEMPALVAAVPQVGRFLRPLCHMLDVKRPVYLRLPRRRSSPRPSPRRGEGEEKRERAVGEGRSSPRLVRPAAQSPQRGEGEEKRVLSWVEEDAPAMRARVARWVAEHADPPSTLLPMGLSPELDFPGTRPFGPAAKNRG